MSVVIDEVTADVRPAPGAPTPRGVPAAAPAEPTPSVDATLDRRRRRLERARAT